MGFPDRIERTVRARAPAGQGVGGADHRRGPGRLVRQAGDDRPAPRRVGPDDAGRAATGRHAGRTGGGADGVRLHLAHRRPARRRPAPHLRRVHARAGRGGDPADRGRDRLRPAARRGPPHGVRRQHRGLGSASWASWSPTSMPPDLEAVAEQVFIALADPTRRGILAALAAGGPATATDLADRLPITRQAIAKHLALLAEAGLVTAEPGERRRVRYRLRSARCRWRSSSWPRWPATGTARSTRCGTTSASDPGRRRSTFRIPSSDQPDTKKAADDRTAGNSPLHDLRWPRG